MLQRLPQVRPGIGHGAADDEASGRSQDDRDNQADCDRPAAEGKCCCDNEGGPRQEQIGQDLPQSVEDVRPATEERDERPDEPR